MCARGERFQMMCNHNFDALPLCTFLNQPFLIENSCGYSSKLKTRDWEGTKYLNTHMIYDPQRLNLLSGSSCSNTHCVWNCFPWDVTPVNVTVLAGLTSRRSRWELLEQGSNRGRDDRCMFWICLFMPSLFDSVPFSNTPPHIYLVHRFFTCCFPCMLFALIHTYFHSAPLFPCCHGYYFF